MTWHEVHTWLGGEGRDILEQRGELYRPGTKRFTDKAVRIAFSNRDYYVGWRGI